MIEVCRYCRTPKLVLGPRNLRRRGFCGGPACTARGLLELASDDLISREEADRLNGLLDVAAAVK